MKEAKLKYKQGSFEIIREGEYVLCAISKKKILLKDLKYWNVRLQEPYFSPIEISQKFK
tara:strand:- start:193 stop:369 length:177 start_codon:yes stop_codon:yes gene_type:complete